MLKEYNINLKQNPLDYQNNLLEGIFKLLKQEQIKSKMIPVFNELHNDKLKIYYFDGAELDGTLLKVELDSDNGDITLMGKEEKINKIHGFLESILELNLEAQFVDHT